MTLKTRKKRFHLSLVAEQTRKMLFFFLSFCAVSLFILHLFLMNHLAMRGYILTRETKTNQELVLENEQLEATIARMQTQAFLTKLTPTKQLVFRERQKFVVVPVRLTAKK